jgi:DNA invertase Pin-like site-specific DNA recombinase
MPFRATGQPTTTIRFVELVRVSSQGQADRDTPEDQRAALLRLRLAHPGDLVEVIDSAVSGANDSDHRADLQRLATLARARAFDEVRVRHLDRLTRHEDPRERFLVYGIIADAGAVIRDATGRVIDPRSELGELTWYFETLMASKERRRILERTRAGRERLVREGRLVHGKPPYGRTFDKRTGKWGLDEEEATVYRRMFEACLAGRSTRDIAKELVTRGVPTRLGGTWSAAHVSRLLRQPTAYGVYKSWGHSFTIPAIVDEPTAKAAIAKLKANNCMSGPKPTTPTLLQKLLVCGLCGSPMYVDKGGKGASATHYYVCSARGSCGIYHRVDRLDEAVRKRVEEWVRDPEREQRALSRGIPAPEDFQKEVEGCRRELVKLDKEEERLARLMRRGLLSEKASVTQLGEVNHLRAEAQARLDQAKARQESAALRSQLGEALEAQLAAIRRRISKATPKDWRDLVTLLFPRGGIRVFPNGDIRLDGAVPLDSSPNPSLSSRSPRRRDGAPRPAPGPTTPSPPRPRGPR